MITVLPSSLTRRHVLAGGLIAPLMVSACASAPLLVNPEDDPFSESSLLSHLVALGETEHLRSGSPGDLAILERTQVRLEEGGFATTLQRVDRPFFDSKRCAVVFGDREVEVFPQHAVVSTGPSGISGPLRLWHDPADTAALCEAIGVVVLPHRRHSRLLDRSIRDPVEAALEGKPKALILITQGPSGETLILNAPADGHPFATVPLVVLGPGPGRDLIAAASCGQTATLVIEGESGMRAGFNLVGRIERARPEAPLLVVSTPRTAWTPAVAERGPGYANFLAFAAWAPRALPDLGLLFLSTTAHEFDNAGALAFLSSGEAPSAERVALWIHFGAGFAGRAHHDLGDGRLVPLSSVDDQRFLMGSDLLIPVLREAFAGQAGLEHPYPASEGAAGELKEILEHGYSPAFGLFGAHSRHHAMSDRLMMTDVRWVREVGLAARTATLTHLRKAGLA